MNFKIDLKNIDLKNISLEDIQAKLKNVDKKTWIKLGVSVGAVVFFLVIFYAVLNPIVNKKKAQLDDMNKKKEETAKFVSDIKSKNKKIKLKRPQYEQYSTLFHTKAEVEGLYQTLSEFAAMNNLSEHNLVAPYKLIGLQALSVDSATTRSTLFSKAASITF